MKRSRTRRFRYFDAAKNKGGYAFRAPCEEQELAWPDFEDLLESASKWHGIRSNSTHV